MEEQAIKELSAAIKKLTAQLSKSGNTGPSSASLEQQLKMLKEKEQLVNDILSTELDIAKATGDAEKENRKLVESAKEKIKLLNKEIKIRHEHGNLSEQQRKTLLETIDLLEQQIEGNTKLKDLTEEVNAEQLAASENLRSYTADIIQKYTGITSLSNTWLGNLVETSQKLGGISQALKVVGKQITTQFQPLNVASSYFQKVTEATWQFVKAQDEAFAAFTRATGAGDEYKTMITEVYTETRNLGVDVTEVTAATEALHRNMLTFKNLSQGARSELIMFTSVLNEAGVQYEITSQAAQIMNSSFKMSTNEIKEYSKELVDLGVAIGSPEEAMRLFISTAPQLAQYGDRAKKVFKELALSSRTLGVEMQSLISIADGMDTFEGAAEAAAGLNAMLGGNLVNSVDLLLADADQIPRMLIATMEASGRTWKSLDRFAQKAIAAKAGISSLADASSIFNQSLSEYDENMRRANLEAMRQKGIEEMAKRNQAMMEQLKTLAMEFAALLIPVIRPVVEFFKDTLQYVIDLNKEWGGWLLPTIFGTVVALTALFKIGALVLAAIKGFGLAMTVLGSILPVVGGGMQALGASMMGVGSSAPAAAGGLASLGKGVGAFGKAAASAVPVVLAFGAAILMAGAGILGAAYGLSLLANAVKDMTGEGLAAMGVMTAMILAMGIAGYAAGPGMLFLGGGMLMVGGAAVLIGLGMKLVVSSFETFFEIVTSNMEQFVLFTDTLKTLSLSMAILTFSMLALGAGTPLVVAGLIGMAIGLTAVAGAVALIKTDDLVALGQMFGGLGQMAMAGKSMAQLSKGIDVFVEKVEKLSKLRSGFLGALESLQLELMIGMVEKLSSAMDNIATKAEAFTAAMTPIASLVETAAQLEGGKMTQLERFSQSTVNILEASTEAAVFGSEKTLKALSEAMSASNSGGAQNSQNARQGPIVLEVDKRVFARQVNEAINESAKWRVSNRSEVS